MALKYITSIDLTNLNLYLNDAIHGYTHPKDEMDKEIEGIRILMLLEQSCKSGSKVKILPLGEE